MTPGLIPLEPGPDAAGLTCYYGYPWANHFWAGHHCPACLAATRRTP
jgi:hypothetical protein